MLYPLSYGRAGDSVAQTGAGLRGDLSTDLRDDLRVGRDRDGAPSCGIAREVNTPGCGSGRRVALGPMAAGSPKVA